MRYNACGHYLIVQLDKAPDEATSEGGIILASSVTNKNKEQSGMAIATVLDIGSNCWAGFYDREGDSNAWCKVGDKVMIAKYAGQGFPVVDKTTLEQQEEAKLIKLIKDDDVLAVENENE